MSHIVLDFHERRSGLKSQGCRRVLQVMPTHVRSARLRTCHLPVLVESTLFRRSAPGRGKNVIVILVVIETLQPKGSRQNGTIVRCASAEKRSS